MNWLQSSQHQPPQNMKEYLDENQGASTNLMQIERLFQVLVLYFFELSRFITFDSIIILINIYHVLTDFLY